jgi:hypothetical protein
MHEPMQRDGPADCSLHKARIDVWAWLNVFPLNPASADASVALMNSHSHRIGKKSRVQH